MIWVFRRVTQPEPGKRRRPPRFIVAATTSLPAQDGMTSRASSITSSGSPCSSFSFFDDSLPSTPSSVGPAWGADPARQSAPWQDGREVTECLLGHIQSYPVLCALVRRQQMAIFNPRKHANGDCRETLAGGSPIPAGRGARAHGGGDGDGGAMSQPSARSRPCQIPASTGSLHPFSMSDMVMLMSDDMPKHDIHDHHATRL